MLLLLAFFDFLDLRFWFLDAICDNARVSGGLKWCGFDNANLSIELVLDGARLSTGSSGLQLPLNAHNLFDGWSNIKRSSFSYLNLGALSAASVSFSMSRQ